MPQAPIQHLLWVRPWETKEEEDKVFVLEEPAAEGGSLPQTDPGSLLTGSTVCSDWLVPRLVDQGYLLNGQLSLAAWKHMSLKGSDLPVVT